MAVASAGAGGATSRSASPVGVGRFARRGRTSTTNSTATARTPINATWLEGRERARREVVGKEVEAVRGTTSELEDLMANLQQALDERESELKEARQARGELEGIVSEIQALIPEKEQELEAALEHMNPHGRIVMCGMISMYNATEPVPGPANLAYIITKKLTMQGFIVTDHFDKMQQFHKDMAQWIGENKIKWKETVVDGIENAPGAFIGLFKGENFGKMIVKIGPDLGS